MANWWNNIKEKGASARVRLSSNWHDFSEQMHHKHRLVVMDTDNFKEKISFELTGTNLFTFVGISLIVLIAFTTLLIAVTPLHYLIPGYIRPHQREEIARNAQAVDSLQSIIDQHNVYIANLQDVLSGKPLTTQQTEQVAQLEEEAVVYKHSKADSLLRLEIEARHKADKKSKK